MSEQSISNWGQVLLFIIGGLAFVTAALLVSRIIRPSRPNPEKLTSYESGEDPIGSPWAQFNIRFYVIALVFLLFEVEIVFLFPWATIFSNKELIRETDGAWGWFAMGEMIVFIGLLALGLAYAWRNGHLDWIKSTPRVTEFKSPVPGELYKKVNERYSSK
ncbi:MAG TPA: NADH-quinone oxidoreductase subunit A [Cyclobacteriaceae bacterium]|nr:NADH-quinone oxidoreductase subunit A [Cyclobacteriaceae bacterium]